MTNREIIESALKRVNALAGTNGKLYKDNTGWYIINRNKTGDAMRLDEASRGVEAILSYLHGIEDAFLFINNKEDKYEQDQITLADAPANQQDCKRDEKNGSLQALYRLSHTEKGT